jgi:hypothetical protein
MVGVRIFAKIGPHEWDETKLLVWCCVDAGNTDRAAMVSDLESRGGHHLLIVRYKPEHSVHNEWVYNKADIDRSPVVFAREMDPASNARLIEYFRDRQAWLLEPDESPPRLSPYPGAVTAGSFASGR